MTRPVQRGEFTRTCDTCGHTRTYSTQGHADAYFPRHSCDKRLDHNAKSTAYRQRLAAIDRTPKPCLHKIANHVHGTRACYTLDGCRCTPCGKAAAAAENERMRQIAYGRHNPWVDAAPVQEHLAALTAYGIGLRRVAELAGLNRAVVQPIAAGRRAHVRPETAAAILAVEAAPNNLADKVVDHHRSEEATLKMRALVRLGWSLSALCARLGITRQNGNRLTSGDTQIKATIDRIFALYEELSMTPPPERTPGERSSAARARNYAIARGWAAPLDLEAGDVTVVDDDIDEAAIQRRLDGDTTVDLTVTERREIVTRMHRWGLSTTAMAKRTGISVKSLGGDHRALGLTPHPLESRSPVPARGGTNSRRRTAVAA